MYITAKDFALRNGVNERIVRIACNKNRIKGARRHRMSHMWMIPESAECPIKPRKK